MTAPAGGAGDDHCLVLGHHHHHHLLHPQHPHQAGIAFLRLPAGHGAELGALPGAPGAGSLRHAEVVPDISNIEVLLAPSPSSEAHHHHRHLQQQQQQQRQQQLFCDTFVGPLSSPASSSDALSAGYASSQTTSPKEDVALPYGFPPPHAASDVSYIMRQQHPQQPQAGPGAAAGGNGAAAANSNNKAAGGGPAGAAKRSSARRAEGGGGGGGGGGPAVVLSASERRARNRLASAKYRQKKSKWEADLLVSHDKLKDRCKQLEDLVEALLGENDVLRARLGAGGAPEDDDRANLPIGFAAQPDAVLGGGGGRGPGAAGGASGWESADGAAAAGRQHHQAYNLDLPPQPPPSSAAGAGAGALDFLRLPRSAEKVLHLNHPG